MSKYTLPDGATTTNEVQYIREWQSTAQRIERALDVTVISSNPGFQIADKDGAVTSIPMWLVSKIIGITEARDEARMEVCKMVARTRRKAGIRGQIVGLDRVTPAEIAAERGWDCFAQQEGGGA